MFPRFFQPPPVLGTTRPKAQMLGTGPHFELEAVIPGKDPDACFCFFYKPEGLNFIQAWYFFPENLSVTSNEKFKSVLLM